MVNIVVENQRHKMDYLLFSVVLATTLLACLILLCSAFKIFARCLKRKTADSDIEEGSFQEHKQCLKPPALLPLIEEKNLVVKTQDCNISDSFIEGMTETSSFQTSSASNLSIGSPNDSGIHEYEDGTHSSEDDSIDLKKRDPTLKTSFQSLDLSGMFREADKETGDDNSDSTFGFSDHPLVDADFINIESEIQEHFTMQNKTRCESTFPTTSLFGLINKLSYFYCL